MSIQALSRAAALLGLAASLLPGPALSQTENSKEVSATAEMVETAETAPPGGGAVDETHSFADTLTVQAVSRQPERLVDAPAAVTLVTAESIELEGTGGQIPALLSATVGAEPTQNGLYDYNFNVRGFNSFLNRRIQTIIDGRDPSITDTSSQEWFSFIALTEDLESIELVRGPSSALYGPNSVNGVLNLVTKAPRDSQGGSLRLTGGELSTAKVDLRWAGALGRDWYAKVLGNHTESETFTVSRDRSVEYAGLPPELVPLPSDEVRLDSGLLRLDKYLPGARVLSVEGAIDQADGGIFMTPAQRAYVFESPPAYWSRINLTSLRWNLQGSYADREAEALALAANVPVFTKSHQYDFELQGNQELLGDRVRVVGGLSYGEEEVDSTGPNGLSLYSQVIQADRQSVFGQIDARLSGKLTAVVALRWDDSSLHPQQLTPKGSLVYGLTPNHTLRLSYNEAFQVANYSELFLFVPAGPPLDLSALGAFLPPLPPGVDLGLSAVPIFDLGNPDLDVEKIKTVELGYRGILGRNLLMNVDVYRSNLRDFISSVPPGFDPRIPAYQAPAGLPPELRAAISAILNQAFPGLTNGPDGSPRVALSRLNTGEIDSEGVELSLTWSPINRLLLNLNGSWFDFTIREETLGAQISPNRPDFMGGLGVTWHGDALGISARYRWVEAFHWSSGLWIGEVPSYEVLDLSASYDLTDHWTLGIDVANALDDQHYEAFGADVLKRRALGYVKLAW